MKLKSPNINSEDFMLLEKFVEKTDYTYSFDGEVAMEGIKLLLKVVKDMGLDPMKTEDLKSGIMAIFNIEVINMPDLNKDRFILTPNHVSDLDAIILGLLHPKIRIVAKNDWINNKKLRGFLDLHYDLCGLERTSLQSLRTLLTEATHYFNDSDENKHYLVFSQGTISDFNNNSLERISPIAQKISNKTGVPILNMFIEQASIYEPTRIVFDSPIKLSPKDDFRKIWLEREMAMQNSLVPKVRYPKLSYKHMNNNKEGEEFF